VYTKRVKDLISLREHHMGYRSWWTVDVWFLSIRPNAYTTTKRKQRR